MAKAQIEAEAELIHAQAAAQAVRIKAQAELAAEQERLRALTELLDTHREAAPTST